MPSRSSRRPRRARSWAAWHDVGEVEWRELVHQIAEGSGGIDHGAVAAAFPARNRQAFGAAAVRDDVGAIEGLAPAMITVVMRVDETPAAGEGCTDA